MKFILKKIFSLIKSAINSLLLLNSKKTEDFLVEEYIVRKNDSFWKIAKKFSIRQSDIAEMNNVSLSKTLHPGDKLLIPTQGYNEYLKSQLESTKKIYYTVKRGDTLGEIAQKFRTSIKKIKAWNGIRRDSDVIRIGKILIVHIPSSQNVDSKLNDSKNYKVIYVVKSGDTLSGIGLRYNVSVKKLKRWNNLNGSMLSIGQKLIIYTK